MRDEPNAEIKCVTLGSLDPTNGVGKYRQPEGDPGSRYPLRSV
jgi:hypothetical protein